ncbi:protein spaetzle isoform X2 [Phymastichus coffea]|uniref:protein spaetzle isoform X2 n=1 Tax=Phymastichus coffea TaxID=108790 RepID=UPI00273B2E58|nr:protein spaetzle isoform X2 [Phymastichus coffea]
MVSCAHLILLIVLLHTTVISVSHSWPHRQISSKLEDDYQDDVPSRSDGKIIFPTEKPEISMRQYTPHKPLCNHSTFCEDVPNYPNNIIDVELRMNKDLKLLSVSDSVPDDISNRMNGPSEDNSLCDSYEKIVFPKSAESKSKEWFFIVNQDNFRQGVRVEICGNENSVCDMFDGFYEGYKTICKQKYIYRQLVALSRNGQMKPETFRFPSSCCCHIKFTGDLTLRMGLNKNKTSTSKT